MKVFAFIAIFAGALSSFASGALEEVSPHFATNADILWHAPTNDLPKHFWMYKKMPRVFSATTISNAIILASFQSKGFPRPSTNQIVLWGDHSEGEPEPPYFSILPDTGQLSFTLGDRAPASPEQIAINQAAVERAWACLARLGLDRSQFVKTNDASGGGYGVFLPRQRDGLVFDGSEGFQIQFGKGGNVRQFCLLWPNLERKSQSQTASPSQIIACIRAFKTPLLPDNDEPDYFGRVKHVAQAGKLIITKITPYYGEGVYGEMPGNDAPKFIAPVARLEAIADFGSSNQVVRMLAPVTLADVCRLLKK